MKNIFKNRKIKKVFLIVPLFILASGASAILIERAVFPYLQELPVLRDISFFDSRTPIVITRREEIRIDGGVNTQEVINRTRGSLVRVYASANITAGQSVPTFFGFIATNDGLVLIPGKDVKRGDDVTVVLENGQAIESRVQFVDSVSGIGFVKIGTGGLPVLNEAASREKNAGEPLLALGLASNQGVQAKNTVLTRRIATEQSISVVQDLSVLADTIVVDSLFTESDLGSIIVDKDGSLVGFVSFLRGQATLLRVDDVRLVLDNFLRASSLEVKWPQLRLSYLSLGQTEAGLMGLPREQGVMVRQSGSAIAGPTTLVPGDFIYEIDGREITAENSFQTAVLSRKPGEKMTMKILRKGLDMIVEITL